MTVGAATRLLAQEARALPQSAGARAALRPPRADGPGGRGAASGETAIERYLAEGRREFRGLVAGFLRWLSGPRGQSASAAEAQRRFTYVRLRFQAVLTQFDIFADALGQRSEHETGVRLAGLDVVARDALTLPGRYYEVPPVICYLDRGHGAAIRRARTRLPGGGENPVAIIRVPRERMIGSGIASSLVHEVGHQGAALLEVIPSLRLALRKVQRSAGEELIAWQLWERWISEIIADFWSVAHVGVSATVGLLSVVSLPRAFVFRISMTDPHPFPWIRVLLGRAIGNALYPHQQWDRLDRIWEAFYPLAGLDAERAGVIARLRATMPDFVLLLMNHRPESLGGRSLREALASPDCRPERLAKEFSSWRLDPERMRKVAPSLVFAAIGQAKADDRVSPEEESRILADLLTFWALRSSLDSSADCAARPTLPNRLAERRLFEPIL